MWSSLGCKLPEPFAKLLADLGVQRPERLVEKQYLRIRRQSTGERDTLPLPTGELVGVAIFKSLQTA